MSLRHAMVALLLLAVVASGVAVVYSRHLSREAFSELQRLQKRHDRLQVEWGRLQLEQATWAEPARTTERARSALGMRRPEANEIVVIQR